MGNTKLSLFTERSRIKSELEPNLPKHLKGQYEEVFGANRKFVLLRIEKGLGPLNRQDRQAKSESCQARPGQSV